MNRTWLWGPTPGQSAQEPFKEGPGGQHLVQYFDKARMEINNPSANPNDPFYVTNGLLVVEMISGRMQTGANQFEIHDPSYDTIGGDPGSDAPPYAALRSVSAVGIDPQVLSEEQAPGQVINPLYIGRVGTVTNGVPADVQRATGVYTGTGPAPLQTLPQAYTVRAAHYVQATGHNIADVFWNYLNSQGPIYQNGSYVNGPLMDWVSTVGYPVTDPLYTSIKVQGRDKLIVFQAFQRRILTYSPDNPEGWKVEMANVGAQYYKWRYQTPTTLSCARVPVRGFGKVWSEHLNVQQGVGCPQPYAPFAKEQVVQITYEPFEHGTVLEVTRTIYSEEHLVYVFFDDGTFQQFDDTWQPGDPVNGGLTPPAGRYEPQKGIGKVWREGTGARVRERLGWATLPEKAAAGAYQWFETGEMYWTDVTKKIYVLYGSVNGYSPYPPTPVPGSSGPALFRYDVYDDTYILALRKRVNTKANPRRAGVCVV